MAGIVASWRASSLAPPSELTSEHPKVICIRPARFADRPPQN